MIGSKHGNNQSELKKNAGLRQQHLSDGLNRPAVHLAMNRKRSLGMYIELEEYFMQLFYYNLATISARILRFPGFSVVEGIFFAAWIINHLIQAEREFFVVFSRSGWRKKIGHRVS